MNKKLESPVGEAIRQMKGYPVRECRATNFDCSERTCATCEHFVDEDENGYTLNWCYLNDTEVDPKDTCDDHSKNAI